MNGFPRHSVEVLGIFVGLCLFSVAQWVLAQ